MRLILMLLFAVPALWVAVRDWQATIGAGSVITANAPADKLTLARGRQTTIKDWKRPQKT